MIKIEKRRKVFNLRIMSSYYVTCLRYFIKQGTSLGYFYGSQRAPFISYIPREQTTVVEEMGLSKEDRILIENIYE